MIADKELAAQRAKAVEVVMFGEPESQEAKNAAAEIHWIDAEIVRRFCAANALGRS